MWALPCGYHDYYYTIGTCIRTATRLAWGDGGQRAAMESFVNGEPSKFTKKSLQIVLNQLENDSVN